MSDTTPQTGREEVGFMQVGGDATGGGASTPDWFLQVNMEGLHRGAQMTGGCNG